MPIITNTLPYLNFPLVPIGFSYEIGAWIFSSLLSDSVFTQAQATIVVLASLLSSRPLSDIQEIDLPHQHI